MPLFREKWYQIGRKRLKNVPIRIIRHINNNTLKLKDYLKYNLDGIVPIEQLDDEGQATIAKIGVEKAKTLDFDFLDSVPTTEWLEKVNFDTPDINRAIYLTKYEKGSIVWRERVIEALPEYYIDASENLPPIVIEAFNRQQLTLDILVKYFDSLKNKNLSSFFRDKSISEEEFRKEMEQYGELIKMVPNIELDFLLIQDDDQREADLKIKLEKLLSHNLPLSPEQYEMIFSFWPIDEYIKIKYGDYIYDSLIEGLQGKDLSYLYNNGVIPFDMFFVDNIYYTVKKYGIDNIIAFDRENNGFLTRDDFKVLRSLYENFLHYASNNLNSSTMIGRSYDENNQPIPRDLDYFYEDFRRMLFYHNRRGIINYKNLTGKFKNQNPELFIFDGFPDELKDAWYSGNLTPSIIDKYPDYKERLISVIDWDFVIFKKSLAVFEHSSDISQNELFQFWYDYYNYWKYFSYVSKSSNANTNIKELIHIFNERLYDIILLRDKILSEDLPSPFKEEHPELFLDKDVPIKLKEAYYSGNLTPDFFSKHPDYRKKYMYNIDWRVLIWQKLNLQPVGEHIIRMDDLIGKSVSQDELFQFWSEYYDYLNVIHYSGISCDTLKEIISLVNKELYSLIKDHYIQPSEDMPSSFKEEHPELFLDKDVPIELKEAYYSGNLTPDFFSKHPDYREKYMNNIDWRVLIWQKLDSCRVDELDDLIGKSVSQDELFQFWSEYYCYFDIMKLPREGGLKEIISSVNKQLYLMMKNCKIQLSENMPSPFKEEYAELFSWDKGTPNELKELIIQGKLSYEHLKEHPDWSHFLNSTKLLFGFDCIELMDCKAIIDLPTDRTIELLNELKKIENQALKNRFISYVSKQNGMEDSVSFINVSRMLFRLENSNSSELRKKADSFAGLILSQENIDETLDKIENVFLKNDVPTVGKVFKVFEILHTNSNGKFSLDSNNKTDARVNPLSNDGSPTLNWLYSNSNSRFKNDVLLNLVFSDLLNCSLGSNNRNMRDYIDILKEGNRLFEDIQNGEVTAISLDEQIKLKKYASMLRALYDNSKMGREKPLDVEEDVIKELSNLTDCFKIMNVPSRKLPDRIVSMFGHGAGFDSVEDLESYMEKKTADADKKNRERAMRGDFSIVSGDFVKCINALYLENILQNGSLCQEFLGADASSDFTPLDTDLARVTTDTASICSAIEGSLASGFGDQNTYLVLKNDGRFHVTREGSFVDEMSFADDIEGARRDKKIELFETGGSFHFGIRTGFASSEIDYIVVKEYSPKYALEIVKNGFYIPVIDMDGKLLFSPDDYDNLRKKMQGLSHYGESHYEFSDKLDTPRVKNEIEIIGASLKKERQLAKEKRDAIYSAIQNELNNSNLSLELKRQIDIDISEGSIELIDTGSTGRGTNIGGDSDFDFVLRVDREIMQDEERKKALKEVFIRALNLNPSDWANDNKINTPPKKINGCNDDLLIQISFETKSDEITYSTDMAVKDRLETIRKQDEQKYYMVVANIILAKKVLKEAGVYEKKFGGLGGVGVENWILENGGSFEEACETFLSAARGKTYSEFAQTYEIWDFGENHYSESHGIYKHDNFIMTNLKPDTYTKMVEALEQFMNNDKKKDKPKIGEME